MGMGCSEVGGKLITGSTCTDNYTLMMPSYKTIAHYVNILGLGKPIKSSGVIRNLHSNSDL